MTDIERNAIFAKKKKEIINRLLGEDTEYPIPEAVTTKAVDMNWNRGKSWHDSPRILPNMNTRNGLDTTLYEFARRNNGGVVVTVTHETLEEVPPPIK